MKILQKNKEIIFVVLLLILAAFLRLYRIADYMTFLGDEGRDALVVYKILHGQFTLLGPTSSVGGFFLGPIYYYFSTPFLWLFNYNPVGTAVMVALFGTATVWLLYKITKEFFGFTAASITSVLYAISPLVLSYSRSSWNPNLMPFFTLLTMYMLYKALQKNNMWLLLFSGFLFGISMQLHYVEVFIGAIIALYIFLINFLKRSDNKNSWINFLTNISKEYLLFFFGFIGGLAPFWAFEVRHGFPNTQSIVKFIFSSGYTGGSENLIPKLLDLSFRVFARLLTNYPPADQIAANLHANIGIWTFLTAVLGIASIGIFLLHIAESFKKRDRKFFQLILLFTWFFLGIFIFGFYKKSIYDYYFAFMFPLPFIFVGNAFLFLIKKNIFIKCIAIIAFIALLVVNIRALPFWFPANRQLAQAETIARFVYEKAEGKPFNFALITGGNSDHAYRYFFKLWGNDPVVIQNPQLDPERKTVTEQLLVVCENLPCSPQGVSLWEIAGYGRADIAGKWSVSVVDVYKLVPYKGL